MVVVAVVVVVVVVGDGGEPEGEAGEDETAEPRTICHE